MVMNIPLRVRNEGRQRVVSVALPVLRKIMVSEAHCSKPPRDQVRLCLLQVESDGNKFWGQWDLYTRKRTVEDLILSYYYDSVRASL